MSLESAKNIVLILSGKGGVGKSSVTTQLALSLSLAGKSVGILDIDLTGPSIPRFLGLENAKITQAPGGWLPVEVHKQQTLPPLPYPIVVPAQNEDSPSIVPPIKANPTRTNQQSLPRTTTTTTTTTTTATTTNPPTPPHQIGALHAISLAFLLPTRSSAVIWRGPKRTAMVRQFLTDVLWPPSGIDYLLIDTPPGTSDEHIALAETLRSATTTSSSTSSSTSTSPGTPRKPYLAGALIVTTPQAVAISDVRKEINFCRKTAIAILGVVENMAGYVCECCGEMTDLFGRGGGEDMAREFGVRFLGGVAVDGAWGRLVEEGRRPVYGMKEVDDGEDEEGYREGGLLVDKYRNCRLCGTFEGIAREVMGIVEGVEDGR